VKVIARLRGIHANYTARGLKCDIYLNGVFL